MCALSTKRENELELLNRLLGCTKAVEVQVVYVNIRLKIKMLTESPRENWPPRKEEATTSRNPQEAPSLGVITCERVRKFSRQQNEI